MTSRALVSVVVPVHNVVDYLDDCLSSITSQTEPNIEIVLVDDGSTDGSDRVCDEWAGRDTRIRTIHQSQQGSSVARNTGIDLATGSFLTFVDADDLVGPRLIEQLVQTAEQTCADIVLGEISIFTDTTAPKFTEGSSVTVLPAAQELAEIICVRPQWGPMAKLFRRELFEDGPRFPEGLLHQDLAIMPRLFERAGTCARSDAVVYGYRDRPGSVTDTVRRVALSTDLLTIVRDNIEFARATQPQPDFERYLVAYLIHARKRVERLRGKEAWRRNVLFVAAYQSLIRDYRTEVLSAASMTVTDRAAFLVSARTPRSYVRARTAATYALRAVRGWRNSKSA